MSCKTFYSLKKKYHESAFLQKDFCLYDIEFFKFEILYFEEDFKKLRELEQKLIFDLQHKCYNLANNFQIKKLAQQISIDGKIYDSIKQAEKITKISKITLIRRLDDPNNLTFIH
jgi:hypothetical protein